MTLIDDKRAETFATALRNFSSLARVLAMDCAMHAEDVLLAVLVAGVRFYRNAPGGEDDYVGWLRFCNRVWNTTRCPKETRIGTETELE